MEHNNLQQNVLEKIKAGEIKMQSKTYFMLHIIVLIVIALLVLLTSSFLISFLFFSIHASGRLFLLGFGLRGMEIFIMTFPWGVLLIDAVFIIILEWLLKRFQFSYRYPILYTLGGIVVITVVTGFIIEKTPLHMALMHQEQRGAMPVIGGFYDSIRRPPHESGVFRGTVISVLGATFMIENADRDNDADNIPPSGASSTAIMQVFLEPSVDASTIVTIGDTVFVAGDVSGNSIHAYGIKKILPGDEPQ